MKKPLVDKEYLLEKFPGKGGWTYASIPEVSQSKTASFGWVKVCGNIDDFELKQYNLAPMGDGRLFLPVRKEIRKKIGKEAGDWVRVTLYADDAPTEIPEEIALCLREDEEASKTFWEYSDGERKQFLDWIYSARTDEKRVERIAATLIMLEKRQKFGSRK